MPIFIATLIIFLLVFLGMALGYILRRKSIRGSCGRLDAIGIEKECDCPEPCDARKQRMKEQALRENLLEAIEKSERIL